MQKIVPGFWRKFPINHETNISAVLRFENPFESFVFLLSVIFRETTSMTVKLKHRTLC